MPNEIVLIVALSALGTLVLLGHRATRDGRWRQFFFFALLLGLFGYVLNTLFGFPAPSVVAKGQESDPATIAALYISMVFGMFANYAYTRLDQPKATRPTWDWGAFLAPILISPIIFMTLYGAFLNADLSIQQQTQPRVMLLVVAFQNGFSWRAVFERKSRD